MAICFFNTTGIKFLDNHRITYKLAMTLKGNRENHMTEETYIQKRLDEQIEWYNTKSQKYHKMYKWLKGIEIAISASIPLFVGFIVYYRFWATFVGLLGVIITIIEGFLGLTKCHENWIEYRGICETLKNERYMYLTRTGIYDSELPFKLLVERIERIISKENLNWTHLNSDEAKVK